MLFNLKTLRRPLNVLVFAISFMSLPLIAATANSADRPDHATGLPANTLDEALTNFKTYNGKLEALLAKESLEAKDLHEIHLMSYTLENALQKITSDIGKVAEALESVHLGSETNDKERVKTSGGFYLEQSEKIFGGK